MKTYQETIEQVIQQYETNSSVGLTEKQVRKRLQKYGPNALPEKPEESIIIIFLRQFQSPLIYILLVAALIILFVGDNKLDAFIISGILFFNAIIGTIQEGRTRSLLHQLLHFFKMDTIVLRDDKKQLIQDTRIVPGDIIILREGEQVPADARVIESNNLTVDEAVLTGESAPVRKGIKPIDHKVTLAERKNMVFKGTYITNGSGQAVVVRTGEKTEIGRIGLVAQELQTDMPIKQELNKLSYIILVSIIILCIFLFLVGFALGRPLTELLTMLTALFICVIPEGLPVVLTLVLVTGVYRMAKQNILIKKMQAVEGLGRAQVLIIDKTGTLTRNEMMVSKVCADGTVWKVTGEGYFTEGQIACDTPEEKCKHVMHDLYAIGACSALLNSAEISFLQKRCLFKITGDPTEAALYIFSQKLGLSLEQLKKEYTKLYEIPFHPDIYYHAAFFKKDGKGIAFINGSPEEILKRSKKDAVVDKQCFEKLLKDGLRIVAFAQKEFDLKGIPTADIDSEYTATFFKNIIASDLDFLGFCGIQDSIRSEVPAIIAKTRNAGIAIIMATGDHQKTAEYIAKQVGILKEGDTTLDGHEFNNLSDQELKELLDTTTVYSRLSPEAKLRLVNLFRAEGAIVAMTGDGINDVPSLVAADLGIAMGAIGTEIAKQTSDIILLDDSFANIVNAIEQGRHIFYSLKRVILYFLSTNFAEVLIIFVALITNLPLPLTAAQILWLNFVTDGFLDVGLAMEPQEKGLLYQKQWITNKISLIDKETLKTMVYMAVPMTLGSLAVFIYYLRYDIALARTMGLLTMAFYQWFNAWNCRSLTKSLTSFSLTRNIWLIAATLFVFSLQIALVYVPFMQYIFKTVPLNFNQWLVIIAVSSTIILWVEFLKWFLRDSRNSE